jgi:hypothetical protein
MNSEVIFSVAVASVRVSGRAVGTVFRRVLRCVLSEMDARWSGGVAIPPEVVLSDPETVMLVKPEENGGSSMHSE